jgi:uncharacterized membrane protein YidH (DUF202 family)
MPPQGDDPEDADPGLARERTRMAWQRTAIAFAALGVAVLRRAPPLGLPVLAVTPLIWAQGRLAGSWPRNMPRSRQLLLVTVIVVLVSVLALGIAIFGAGPASLRDIFPRHG